jgi:hypothetical protein
MLVLLRKNSSVAGKKGPFLSDEGYRIDSTGNYENQREQKEVHAYAWNRLISTFDAMFGGGLQGRMDKIAGVSEEDLGARESDKICPLSSETPK